MEKHVLEADGMLLRLPNGRQLLSDVYLRLETGVVAGLLGRNGAGKSTLLQALFGPRAVADASVRHNGRYVHPAYRQPGLVNYLPQTPLLPPDTSLRAAARWLGVAPEAAFGRFDELRARQAEPVQRLSGGLRRTAEALLLLYAPTHFTLLDEPFAGVSPVQLEELAEEISAAQQRKGVFVSDHHYRDLLPLCQRLYLLSNGALRRGGIDGPRLPAAKRASGAATRPAVEYCGADGKVSVGFVRHRGKDFPNAQAQPR